MFFFIIYRLLTFSNINRVSNGADQDQDRRVAGTDMGQNCFQRLSADGKIKIM